MIEPFLRPGTVREALSLQRKLQARAAFLGGGTWLNGRECPRHPEHWISLAGLGLDRIAPARSGVVIGATCTMQEVIDDRRVPAPLRAAVAQIASRNVREIATVGGHVAARDPASDLLPMLIALRARLSLVVPGGSRTMAVEDYVTAPVGGLITRVLVPRLPAGRRAACRNHRASANSRSVVGAAVSLSLVRGAVRDPVIALAGIADHVARLVVVEQALDGKPLPGLDEVQALVSQWVGPAASLAGSADFRRHQTGAIVALALRDAAARPQAARP